MLSEVYQGVVGKYNIRHEHGVEKLEDEDE